MSLTALGLRMDLQVALKSVERRAHNHHQPCKSPATHQVNFKLIKSRGQRSNRGDWSSMACVCVCVCVCGREEEWLLCFRLFYYNAGLTFNTFMVVFVTKSHQSCGLVLYQSQL